jgi:hypothetical protein
MYLNLVAMRNAKKGAALLLTKNLVSVAFKGTKKYD